MNKIVDFLKGKCECGSIGLLVLRVVPAYLMVTNHGWGKITHPENWTRIGGAVTKYFGGLIDFANPIFGFLAAFSESVCSILIILGLFTIPSSLLLSGTMFFAALNHITSGKGSPESALVYLAIFAAITIAGPGKYSIDKMFLSKTED